MGRRIGKFDASPGRMERMEEERRRVSFVGFDALLIPRAERELDGLVNVAEIVDAFQDV